MIRGWKHHVMTTATSTRRTVMTTTSAITGAGHAIAAGEGEQIWIVGEVHGIGPGGFAYAPRGTVHNFRNTSETPSRILVGFTPAGMEGFFRESGRPASDDGQAPPVDQDEIARTMAAAPKYGVEAVAFDD
jgi:hypothetical protein